MRFAWPAFCALQYSRFASGGLTDIALSPQEDRRALIEFVAAERERRQGNFRVIDVGAMGNPWSVQAGVVDAIADLHAHHFQDCWAGIPQDFAEACCSPQEFSPPCFDQVHHREACCRGNKPRPRVVLFPFDITSPTSWESVYKYVQAYGKFDVAICSHVLEDVIDPRVVVRALPLVAKGGWVAMPSKFSELERGREHSSSGVEGRYRGSIHHRWLYTVRNGTLLAVPKLPVLDSDAAFDGVGRVGDRSIEQLSFWWQEDIPFEILNGGFLGTSIEDVVRMLRGAVGPTAVDDVSPIAGTP